MVKHLQQVTGKLLLWNDQIFGFLVGLAFFLSTPAIPVFGPATSTRLALALLMALAVVKAKRLSQAPAIVFLPLLVSISGFLAYVMSYFANGGNVWFSFSWIMLGMLGTLLAFATWQLNPRQQKQFVHALLMACLLIWMVVFYLLTKLDPSMFGSAEFRSLIGDNAPPPGLNRLMNMMVVLSGILLGAVYFGLVKKWAFRLLVFLPGAITLFFAFISGSRQSITAMVIILFFLVILNTKSIPKTFFRLFLATTLLLLLVYGSLKLGVIDPAFAEDRYRSIFAEGITRPDIYRMRTVAPAWEAAREGGSGPGKIAIQLGLTNWRGQFLYGRIPHNGYLYFLSEAGLRRGIPAIAFVLLLSTVAFIKARKNRQLSPLAKASWVVFATLALFMVLLNSLFREPLYFAVLGLAAGFSANSPPRNGTEQRPSDLISTLRRGSKSLNRWLEGVFRRISPGHVILLLAVILSLIQFVFNRSLWLDEAKLALGLIHASHGELLQPLNYGQVAPIAFLQVSKLFSYLSPNAEYGLRLFPLLCFWAALFFFHKTARRLLTEGLPYILAISLFALNITLFYFSSEFKQYMTDLLFAVLMLYLVLNGQWSRKRKFLLLALAGTLGIFFSHVAPIVLLASGAYLFHQSLTSRQASKDKPWQIIALGALFLLVFGIYYRFFISGHPTQGLMLNFWESRDAFMPTNPFSAEFVDFIYRRVGGLMLVSFSPYLALSSPFVALALWGLVSLVRARKTGLLILLLLPVLTHLLLSAFQAYPFYHRLVIYISPYFILAAALGLREVLRRFFSHHQPNALTMAVFPAFWLLIFLYSFPQERDEIKRSLRFISEHKSEEQKLFIVQEARRAYAYYTQTGFFDPGELRVKKSVGRADTGKAFVEQNAGLLSGATWMIFSHDPLLTESILIYLKEDLGMRPEKSYRTTGSQAHLFHFDP